MGTARVVPAAPLAKLVDRARGYAADGRAGSTRKAYLSDFRSFEAWCSSQGVAAMPARPELVPLYATALADVGRCVSSIERAVTAIAQVHRSHGVDWPRSHPALTEVVAGISGRLGARPRCRRRPSSIRSSLRCSRRPATGSRAIAIVRCSRWGGLVPSGAPSSCRSTPATSCAATRAWS